MKDNHDYIRCHMPSGRRFEALIPSLLSAEDHDWLMKFLALLKVDDASDVQDCKQEVTA